MLKHTKKIKEIYEDIQKKLYYMIPEKWNELYLYSSIIDRLGNIQTGELFFYYIPKGILKKNPVNVYEIPTKFNLDEKEYLKLVELLYGKIKELRQEFKKSQIGSMWSSLTLSIEGAKFKVEYDFEDLSKSEFSNYERHIIWRYKYLKLGIEKLSRQQKDIINRYELSPKTLKETESYESGIYIKNIKNIVDYDTENYESTQNVEYIASKNEKTTTNQILSSSEENDKHNNTIKM